ncbi:MAG TPA: AAA family ATPase [Dehalococcoidia bacterium]|nr:AAA family ATPase [Dehalococcoidia bacterium]
MSYEFRPAVRANVPLLLALAGGTGSGKTMSALRVARGIADGKPFAGIDTENGRMLIYADEFPELMHASIQAPFRPTRYTEAIDAADAFLAKQGVPVENRVIVVDSASHEWYGDGGCLDWHDELMGGDQKKNLSAWIEPKRAHKAMVTRLLRVQAHVLLCFRAEPKVEAVKNSHGRIEIVPKASLVGLDGWIPIAEKNLPFEATASFLCMADKPGVPKPIKLPEKLRSMVALDAPLDEQTGRKLAEWAAGGKAAPPRRQRQAKEEPPAEPETASDDNIDFAPAANGNGDGDAIADLTEQLLAIATDENRQTIESAIARNRAGHWGDPDQHAAWLRAQIERAGVPA